MTKFKIILIFFLGLLLASFFWIYFFSKKLDNVYSLDRVVKDSGNYQYISPIIDFEFGQNRPTMKKYLPIKNKIINRIEEENSQDNNVIAVYYQDLNTGAWFGINEKISFAPASLLKLPLMMGIYKLAEDNPNILDNKIIYNGEYENEKNVYAEEETLESGGEYTLQQLIEKMIIHSDNVSRILLIDFLLQKEYIKSFDHIAHDLNLISPTDDSGSQPYVTIKEYASLFRVLHNSSYLDPKYSEKSLGLLAQSTFTNGIVKGLPENIPVAHKYGYGGDNNDNPDGQLHDCGIIYREDNPYILCIFTKGDDYFNLEKLVQDIAITVNEGVDNYKE